MKHRGTQKSKRMCDDTHGLERTETKEQGVIGNIESEDDVCIDSENQEEA